ncbi:TetR/AcrR family transcriptional regulator [Nocardia sp. NPDC052112]|uniref:TetR/AcrR family transcriptional regulator n=1 Tax=Nocardia sp. NPDC052112 TaxID=3155646 RepID=UPI003442A15E
MFESPPTRRQPIAAATPMGSRARRKESTRRALLRSGRRALADGVADAASIHDLTHDVDVATGSFYNHFTNKQELFAAVLAEVVDQVTQILETAVAGVEDPAEVVLTYLRTSSRIGFVDPDIAAIIVAEGYPILERPGILTKAMRAGIISQRFHIHDLGAAMDLCGAVVLGILRTWLRDQTAATQSWVDLLAEHTLVALGVPPADARQLALAPPQALPLLPPSPKDSRVGKAPPCGPPISPVTADRGFDIGARP